MKINPEVINVIKSSQVQDNTLRLPEGKMERKLYEQVSKLLKEMGGKWSSAKKMFVFQEYVAETLADIIAIGEYKPDRGSLVWNLLPDRGTSPGSCLHRIASN